MFDVQEGPHQLHTVEERVSAVLERATSTTYTEVRVFVSKEGPHQLHTTDVRVFVALGRATSIAYR